MIDKKKVLVVIPARMGGYRFPDKPLRKIYGKEMLYWVWFHAMQSAYADEVVIATPDDEIIDACEKFGAQNIKTAAAHRRGTERVYEAFQAINPDADIIVNFQGDEPVVTHKWLDTGIEQLNANSDCASVNLYQWLPYEEAEKDQNEVKVVVDAFSNALYFSRNPLPAIWLRDKEFQCRIEICVMPMWNWAIEKFVSLPNGVYEEIESVDMMRFLENDLKVKMVECKDKVKSVDCQSDLLEAERLLANIYGKKA